MLRFALAALPLLVAGCVQETTYAGGYDHLMDGYKPVAVTDTYCAEAVGEAQDAARIAGHTGAPRDIGRAERTAGFAQRDC